MNVFDVMMKVVALTNGASFVGREVAGGRWHELVAQLPMTVYFAIMFLTWTPRLIRPFLEPFWLLPHYKVQRDMRRILEPIIQQDLDEWNKTDDKKEQLKVKEGQRLPYHKWLMSRYGPGEATPRQLATDQIVTAFESTVSTALTLYYILFQLALRPDLQDELRQEIAENTTDGQLPLTSLNELRKMDSVMRESFRVSPFALCKFTSNPLPHNTLTTTKSPSTASLANLSNSQLAPSSPPAPFSASTSTTSTTRQRSGLHLRATIPTVS
jgi:hypothetical protein